MIFWWYLWLVKIGSGNGVVLPGTKPFLESVAYYGALRSSELKPLLGPLFPLKLRDVVTIPVNSLKLKYW